MSDFPFAMIGFDLDGTLVDSGLDLAPAVNHAMDAAGRQRVSAKDTRSLIGGGARVMLERALALTGGAVEPAEFERLFGLLMTHYEDHIADHTIVYEGCLAALDALASRACQLAVVTNKAEYLARKLVAELGLTGRFCSIIGGDTLGRARSKPAPDMIYETIARCGGLKPGARFAMVGDSSYDVRAAKAAGVAVVAMSFGYYDMPPAELGADALIDHWDEMLPALAKL